MKKIITIVSSIMLLISASFIYAAESNFDIKAGISYPSGPEKVGLDSSISFNIGLDKFFALGIEGGFNWVSWEETSGSIEYGPVPLTQTEKINAYSLPVLLNARLRYDIRDQYGILPFIAAGAGYSWTFFRMTDSNRDFSGFTWQVMGGIAFRLGEGSNMELLIEAGYRGAKVSDENDYELNMSGFVAHAGVRFPIFGGGGSDF